ncbi:ATP-binding protein, partial [SAR116 cluster bacterium]|nr:ATP-binding protein [SAR116 cluster bacterium]
GKSSLIKSTFFSIIKNSKNKLSLIEINREDLDSLPKLLNLIKNLKRQFILYCDDLSFEKSETKFKSLKSVLEGGIEGKPNNVVFYATSNIRHLISSNSYEMKDLNTISQKDHLNETISLSDRFGLWIGFHNIDQNTYLEIIDSYLKHFEIEDLNNEIRENSLKWSIQRGSRSGRVAWQYIVDIAGKLEKKIAF